MQILRISPEDTYPIRHAILRPNRSFETCHFPGDFDDKSFHLGAIVDNALVSVASFYFENHFEIKGSYQYRLRGMATLTHYRGQGLSSNLLKTAFPIIIQNQGKILWCNARQEAIGFYLSVGLKSIGGFFEVADIGPHQLMYIEIDPASMI